MEGGEARKKTAPDQAAQVFNREELLETFLGDAETAASLVARFIERSAEQAAAFPELESGKDWKEARRFAHTIKGSAMTLSGKELGRAAAELERLYKAALDAASSPAALDNSALPDADTLERARSALEEAFGRFRAQAEIFLKNE